MANEDANRVVIAGTLQNPTPEDLASANRVMVVGGGGGVQTGDLASRPATPPYEMVYVANDSSVPVSVWDGTSWEDVDTSTSNVITSIYLSTLPSTFNLTANVVAYPAFLQTEDILHPAGIVAIDAYSTLVAGDTFDISGTKNDGAYVAYSTDSGSTWTACGSFASIEQKTLFFQYLNGLTGTTALAPGTPVRYGIAFRSAAGKSDVQVVDNWRIIARRV